MSSSRSTAYWCHACRRPIRLPAGEPLLCPTCSNGFIEEMPTGAAGVTIVRSGFPDGHGGVPSDMGLGHMGMLTSLLRVLGHDVPLPSPTPGAHSPGAGGGGPLIILGPGFSGTEVRGTGLSGSIGDYFMGSNLEQLIEQLTQNDRCGPPPAPRSAVEAMPAIPVSQRHLSSDPFCPVCQERFTLGSTVREMPCRHIYHGECILPWLNQHNSCPICRTGLQATPASSSSAVASASGAHPPPPSSAPADRIPIHVSGRGGGNANDRTTTNVNSNAGSRTQQQREGQGRRGRFMGFFTSMWPFRSSGSNANAHNHTHRSESPSNDYSNAHTGGWPFEDSHGPWFS